MTEPKLPKAEYRAKRRAERAEAKATRDDSSPCRGGCGRTLTGPGVCPSCYRRGVR